MVTMFDVEVNALITALSQELKNIKEITPPEWADFVKTGMHKERPPIDPDWWYMRAASVLRKVKVQGPVGVAKLRHQYGGKKNRGVRPGKFFKGSGNIIRKVLQQLDKAGLTKQTEKGVHKGRIVTPAGDKILSQAAKKVK